jgi:hypothetical protein
MSLFLPNSGTTISLARARNALGAGGGTGTSYSLGTDTAASLGAHLNVAISRSPTVETSFSAVFGSRPTPFEY